MSKTLQDPGKLRRRAAALIDEARGLQEKIEAEDRAPSEEENTLILNKLEEANLLGDEAAKIDKITHAITRINSPATEIPPLDDGPLPEPNNPAAYVVPQRKLVTHHRRPDYCTSPSAANQVLLPPGAFPSFWLTYVF